MKTTLGTKPSTRLKLGHMMLVLGIPCLIIAGFFALTSMQAAEASRKEMKRGSAVLNKQLVDTHLLAESSSENLISVASSYEENRPNRDFPADGALRAEGGTFQASWQGEEVLLVWETDQETGADQYEIQRSANPDDFIEIGNLSGTKESLKRNLFDFTDPTASQLGGDRLYYRLKQFASNGEYVFSQIIELVQAPKPASLNLSVYPNPASSTVNMRIQGTRNHRAHIQIIDSKGQVVYDELGNANRNLRLLIDSWAEGAYQITLATAGEELSIPLNIIH